VGRHELYKLPCTPEDQPLADPAIEAHFARRMIEHLRRLGAPAENLTRLGLEKIG
jgi:hypothetical protein